HRTHCRCRGSARTCGNPGGPGGTVSPASDSLLLIKSAEDRCPPLASVAGADHAARDAGAGRAAGLRGQVIHLLVDDHALADDAVGAAAEGDVVDGDPLVSPP